MICIDSYNPSSKNPSTMVYNKLQFCTYECWGMTLYINDDFLSQVSSWVTMLLWSLFFFLHFWDPYCVYTALQNTPPLSPFTHTFKQTFPSVWRKDKGETLYLFYLKGRQYYSPHLHLAFSSPVRQGLALVFLPMQLSLHLTESSGSPQTCYC